MAVFLGAFPVLPGKEGDARKFAEETLDRREEFGAAQQRLAVTREEWALQQTPMGSLVVVRFETGDVEEPFDVWFRQRVLDITGVDLSAPMESPPTRDHSRLVELSR